MLEIQEAIKGFALSDQTWSSHGLTKSAPNNLVRKARKLFFSYNKPQYRTSITINKPSENHRCHLMLRGNCLIINRGRGRRTCDLLPSMRVTSLKTLAMAHGCCFFNPAHYNDPHASGTDQTGTARRGSPQGSDENPDHLNPITRAFLPGSGGASPLEAPQSQPDFTGTLARCSRALSYPCHDAPRRPSECRLAESTGVPALLRVANRRANCGTNPANPNPDLDGGGRLIWSIEPM